MEKLEFTILKKIMLIVASVVALGFLFSSFYFFDKDSNNFSVKLECIYNIDGDIYHGEEGGKAWIENCDVNELVVENGTTLTFGGQANEDFKFAGFYADEELLTPLTEPGETSLELPIDRNTTLFAYFAKGYEVSLTLEAEEGSSVTTLTETFYHGEQVSYIHMIEKNLGSEMALKYVNSLPELTEEYLGAPVNLEKVAFMMPAKSLGLTIKPSDPDIVGLSGSGTTEAPYLIATAADLRSVSTLCASTESYRSAYYSLTANIDLNPTLTNVAYNGSTGNIELTVSGTKYYLGTGQGSVAKGSWSGSTPSLTAWTPIGTSSASFAGIINCNSYTISGLFINSSSSSYQAFVGYNSSSSTINDAYFKNSVVVGGSYASIMRSYSIYGGIHKSMVNSNCVVVGSDNVGSMFGYARYGSAIHDSVNYGTVISLGNYCGGLYAQSPYNYWGGTYNCVNHGTVIGTTYVGGLMGYRGSDNNGHCIHNCVNTGTVSGTSNANAIAGNSSPGASYSYYLSGSGGTAYGTSFTTSTVSTVITDLNSRVPGYMSRSYNSAQTNHYYNGWVTNAAGYPTLINDTNLEGSVFSIRFDANGGSGGPGTQYKQKGVAFTIPSTTPARTGYNFLGWNTTSTATTANATYAAGKTYSTDANLTLYAVWDKMWVLTFNANGGSGGPGTQYKEKNVAFTIPSTVPTRTGYNFLGWSTSATATTADATYAAGKTYSTEADLTLYAVWDRMWKIVYNANGGSGAPSTHYKAKGGTTTIATTTPTRTGYTFLGWNPNPAATEPDPIYAPGSSYSRESDLKLAAVWGRMWVITFNANGGSGGPGTQYKAVGTNFTIPSTTPTRTGYTFLGWSTYSNATFAYTAYNAGSVYSIESDLTLYAVWQKMWTVAYNANGGSGAPATQYKTQNVNLTLSTATPTKSGYAFAGWARSSSAVSPEYFPGSVYSSEADITLYAVWGTIGAYGGGNSLGTITATTLNYTASYPWTSATATTTGGGTIYTSGNKSAHGTTSTMKITFTVSTWDPYFYYQISSESCCDKGYVALDSETNYLINYVRGEVSFTKYTITGLTKGTSHTLYFKYTKDSSVDRNNDCFQITLPNLPNIVYNANGGSGVPANQQISLGSTTTLSTTKPTRSNYAFAGWAFSASATEPVFEAGQAVTLYDSVTLYAVWGPVLRVNPNGGTWNSTTATSVYSNTYGATQTIADPTRSGYTFMGWLPTKTVTRKTTSGTTTDTWVQVFYHNNKSGTVLYSSSENLASNVINTADKFSILNKLSELNASYGYEFLLEFDQYAGVYNRWIQTSNPATTTEPTSTATAPGYQALSISWTTNYWGGLGRSTTTSTFIDGSYGHGNWFYAIGSYAKHGSGIPSCDGAGSGSITGVTTLWLKVPNGDYSNFTGLTSSFVNADALGSNNTFYYKQYGSVELQAVWKANTYTVAYNANGGSGSMTSASHTYGVAKALTTNAFTRDGYEFVGWSTSSTATEPTYSNAESVVNLTTTSGGTVTLYAIWKPLLIVDPNGGIWNGTTATTSYSKSVGTMQTISDPIRQGYEFCGWLPTKTMTKNSIGGKTNDTWVQILYHNNKEGTVLFSSSEDLASNTINTVDKFSILNHLSKLGSGYGYEFLLEYESLPGQYNRWIQTSNPVTTAEGSTQTTAPGYKALSISWTNHYWGGLGLSSSTGTFIDGTYGHTDWYYSIGCYSKWSTGIPADGNAETKVTSLWLKVPDGDIQNFYNLNTNISSADALGSNNAFYFKQSSITLKALWKSVTYSVKYNGNGATGGTMTNSLHTYGVNQRLSQNLFVKPGYEFAGWATTSGASTAQYADCAFVKDLTSVTNEIVNLFAVWTPSLTINPNGGTWNETSLKSIIANPEGECLVIADPLRPGYSFLGWFPTKTLTRNTASGESTDLWIQLFYHNNFNGNVMFNATDDLSTTLFNELGKFSWFNHLDKLTASYGYEFLLEYKQYPLAYNRWIQTTNPATTPEGSTVAPAAGYQAISIACSSHSWGGLGKSSSSTTHIDGTHGGNSYYFSIGTYSRYYEGIPSHEKAGESISGVVELWLKVPNGNISDFANFTGDFSEADALGHNNTYYFKQTSIELLATWKQNTYTVQYDRNGGTGEAIDITQHVYDVEQKLPKNTFTRSGFEFLGWSTDSNATTATYTDEQSVVNLTTTNNGTVTLYAVWMPLNYTIKLYDSSTLLGTQTATYNVTLSLTAWATLLSNNSLSASIYAQYGWSFAGWSASTTATSVTYNNGQAVTDISAPGTTINLYAIHTQTLNLTYNGNGSTGGSVSNQEISIYLNSSSKTVSTFATNLASNSFTRKHYTFSKWALGSTSGTQFAAGAAITQTNIALTYNGSFTHTFYAIWQGNSYTINYYNGTTKVNSTTYTYGTSASLKSFDSLNSAVLNLGYGWEFYGWINSTSSYTRLFADQASITTINLGDNSEITAGRTISLYAIYVRTITFVSGLHSEPTTTTAEQYWNSYSTAAANYSSVMASPPQAISNNGWTALGYRADITAGTATFAAKTATEIKPAVNEFNTLYAVYSRTITIADLNTTTTATQHYNSAGTVSTVGQ